MYSVTCLSVSCSRTDLGWYQTVQLTLIPNLLCFVSCFFLEPIKKEFRPSLIQLYLIQIMLMGFSCHKQQFKGLYNAHRYRIYEHSVKSNHEKIFKICYASFMIIIKECSQVKFFYNLARSFLLKETLTITSSHWLFSSESS